MKSKDILEHMASYYIQMLEKNSEIVCSSYMNKKNSMFDMADCLLYREKVENAKKLKVIK